MADTNDSPPGRQRLALDLETILAINEALAEYLDRGDGPIERVHGAITLEIVKGRFHRVIPAPSILLSDPSAKRRARTA